MVFSWSLSDDSLGPGQTQELQQRIQGINKINLYSVFYFLPLGSYLFRAFILFSCNVQRSLCWCLQKWEENLGCVKIHMYTNGRTRQFPPPHIGGWSSLPNRVSRTVGTKDVIQIEDERKESQNIAGGGGGGLGAWLDLTLIWLDWTLLST